MGRTFCLFQHILQHVVSLDMLSTSALMRRIAEVQQFQKSEQQQLAAACLRPHPLKDLEAASPELKVLIRVHAHPEEGRR